MLYNWFLFSHACSIQNDLLGSASGQTLHCNGPTMLLKFIVRVQATNFCDKFWQVPTLTSRKTFAENGQFRSCAHSDRRF